MCAVLLLTQVNTGSIFTLEQRFDVDEFGDASFDSIEMCRREIDEDVIAHAMHNHDIATRTNIQSCGIGSNTLDD